jgi:serine/threonine protein kinase
VNEAQQRSQPFLLANRYRVIRRLGSGRSSDVYAAHDKKMGRTCAIKLLRSDLKSDDHVQRKRLELEAHALAKLEHDAIVSVFDVEVDEHKAWIVMELVDGISLDQAGVLDPNSAANVMVRIADALDTAHQDGILHRDIKPANILQASDGSVKLADFGTAMLAEVGPGLTLAGTPIGTPSFMPPEQAEGLIGQFTPASDIYSMGATLYVLLTGRPPFPVGNDHSVEATLREVIHAKVIPPSQLNADIPPALEAICLKCLERRPQDRLQSAHELQQVLEQFLKGTPVRFSRRTSLKKLATIGVLASGTLGAGISWWQQQNGNPPHPDPKSTAKLPNHSKPVTPSRRLSQPEATTAARTPLPDGPPELVGTLAGHTEPLMSLAFSPDGRTIVSSAEDMTVRFWDVESQVELRQCHPDDSIRIIDTAFSVDGTQLVTGRSLGAAPKVRLVNVKSGGVILEFSGHENWEMVLSVDISSDSKWVAAISAVHGSGKQPRKANVVTRVWNRATGNMAFEVECGLENSMVGLRFLPDNKHLLISTLNDEFGTRLFEIPSQTEVRSYTNSANHIRDIAISSDGSFFCTFASSRLSFFRTHERHVFRSLRSSWCSDFLLTPDDRHLIVAGSRELRVWNIDSKKIVHEQSSETVRFEKIALSPDGRFLVSGGGGSWDSEKRRVIGDGDYAVYLWRLPKDVWPDETELTASHSSS